MEKHFYSFIINIGLLISGLLTVFSGLLIQVEYHMGNHGSIAINDHVFGISYYGWSDIHKISIVMLSLLMIFHIFLHWKWYKVVIMKRIAAKNIQVLTLSVVFIMVAASGLIPWFLDLLNGDILLRKAFIEIHDKLAIILSVYLILHLIKRLKWFFPTFEKIINNTAHTRNIAQKGFSGMRSSSPASSFVSADSYVLCLPFQAILPSLCGILKQPPAT